MVYNGVAFHWLIVTFIECAWFYLLPGEITLTLDLISETLADTFCNWKLEINCRLFAMIMNLVCGHWVICRWDLAKILNSTE